MENVAKGNYSFDSSEWKDVSNLAKDFIRKLLEMDPSKRYSAEQAINDPWMKKYTNEKVVDVPLMRTALTNMKNFRVS
jgi:calcium-dependent protein kinase